MPSGGVIASSRVRASGPWFSDDWTGTNGDPWSSSKWDDIVALDTSTITIQSNQGRMVTQGANYSSVHARAKIPSTVADVDILVKATRGGGEQYPQIYARASGSFTTNAGPPTAYSCWYNPNTPNRRLYLRKRVSTTQTDMAFAAFIWDSGTAWIRFQATGTTVRGKIWLDGDSEPESWTVSTTDSAISAAGDIWLHGVNGNATTARTIDWDDIEVTPL
jgi:hypothetical protein